MGRTKQKSSGSPGKKSGICTMCKRAHPKGKKQRAKAAAMGWKSCKEVAIALKENRPN